MAITGGDDLVTMVDKHKKKMTEQKKAKAQRRLEKRIGTGEKHAGIHSGATSDDFRDGWDRIYGREKDKGGKVG